MRKINNYLRHSSGFILIDAESRLIIGEETIEDQSKPIFEPRNLTEAKQRYYLSRKPRKTHGLAKVP